MNETKKQWLARIVTGGLSAVLLLLVLLYIWDAIPFMGHGLNFRSPAAVLADWLKLYPGLLAANLLFAFLLGAEVGVATLPFADSGRELVVRSLVHFAVTAATVGAWGCPTCGSGYRSCDRFSFFLDFCDLFEGGDSSVSTYSLMILRAL